MDFSVKRIARLRTLPKPEEGFRAVMERAPQAEAMAARAIEKTRPVWTWIYEERRRVATAGVLVLTVWLGLHVMFGSNGMVIYRQKKAELKDLQGEVQQIQEENDRYVQQIKELKTDPKAIEREAREQMHYTRPGEVVYVRPTPPPQSKPQIDSASGKH
jgi:cell division protein FtsB